MMRTSASSALAETVTSIPTLCSCSSWWPGTILRSLNRLPFTVHVRAIVRAMHFARVSFGGAAVVAGFVLG